MRNNFAIWLTGWDFGTYNNFHRWVARIATLQAVIHSVGYTVLIFRGLSKWLYASVQLLTSHRRRMDVFCLLVDEDVLGGW